ncbi:MAG: triose-phosphate isomerase [Campylobacter sp.]|nr:triose-phosphate isomerase [Campylobacter sp.]
MILAANLKCNHTRASFGEYCEFLNANLGDEILSKHQIVVFPPSVALNSQNHKFTQGAQNFYPCEKGSFTGEIGKEMLSEFGIDCVLIGHSERREILGETDELIAKKFEFAKSQDYKIIFCIGENEQIYKNGITKEFLSLQLAKIDLEYPNLFIAYEPIWAIGTGNTATSAIIDEILSFLRTKTKAPLLYGGSVNLKNIAEISQIPSCDGVLVGTASWNAENFINLIKEAK